MTNYLLPLSAVLIGGLIMALWKPSQLKSIKLLLAFSGAFLLSITVFELLPNVYQNQDAPIGYWIMGGMLLQLILEYMSKGAEHGHIHFDESTSFPWAVWFSLCLHSFIEGVPIHHQEHMVWGIFFHKLPIPMLLSFYLMKSNQHFLKSMLLFLLFALATPLGSYLTSQTKILSDSFTELSALVAGMFLHVSTTILFESSEGHSFNASKIGAIILGICIAGLLIH
jgi:hypothetical protein